MSISTITSRDLNQDLSRAKRAALAGPVFITDRGRPAHVLLSIETYEKLVGRTSNLVAALAMSDLSEIEFEPPKAEIVSRQADLD